MTVSVPLTVQFEYGADGVTRAFAFPVRFFEATDIRVSTLDDEQVETEVTGGYTVSGAGGPSGGTVTFATAPASGLTVRLLRQTASKQVVDLEDLTKTPGNTLEQQLDRLAMVGQDLAARFALVNTQPGPKGDDGLGLFRYGSGVPDNALGQDGDAYIDDLTADLYIKQNDAWEFVVGLMGPQGETGATGATGPQGPSGAGTGDLLASQNLNDLANKATAFANIKQAATESATGVVELATDAEAIAGEDTERALTPASGAAAFEKKGRIAGVNAKTANYTLELADAGQLVTMDNAADRTITVPPQSSVTWLSNTRIDLARLGAGNVTIAAGSGVTILSAANKLKIAPQYAGATLVRLSSDNWLLIGSLSA